MRRFTVTSILFAALMLVPTGALAQTTQGPTKIKGTLEVTGVPTFDTPCTVASGCTGSTTAAGANLNITGVTQTGTLGTS